LKFFSVLFNNAVNYKNYTPSTSDIKTMITGIGGRVLMGGRPNYLEKNLSQCHFVHHRSHMDCPALGSKPVVMAE
jgi:hypothetical protein